MHTSIYTLTSQIISLQKDAYSSLIHFYMSPGLDLLSCIESAIFYVYNLHDCFPGFLGALSKQR